MLELERVDDHGSGCSGHHPRGDEADALVGEVAEEAVEPGSGRLDVGVDERDERRRHRGQPGVRAAAGPRFTGRRSTVTIGAATDQRWCAAVVDHDHRVHAGVVEPGGASPGGDDDGHIGSGRSGRARQWVDRAGVEQSIRECGVVARQWTPCRECVGDGSPGRRQSEQAQRRAGDHHGAAGRPPVGIVEDERRLAHRAPTPHPRSCRAADDVPGRGRRDAKRPRWRWSFTGPRSCRLSGRGRR